MFKQLTRKDAERALSDQLNILVSTLPECSEHQRFLFRSQMDSFQRLFKRYLTEDEEIDWSKISLLPNEELKYYADLPVPQSAEIIQTQLNKLVVVKLNGGLGTSMGCVGPKSLISLRNEQTFLDLNIQQIQELNSKFGCQIPLVLMNSFNTEEETSKILLKYQKLNVKIHTFMQSMYPRLNRESLLPIVKRVEPSLLACIADKPGQPTEFHSGTSDLSGWYPPGHGDLYRSFVASGLAEKLLKEGKEWVFISNIDNLGATVDLNILNLLAQEQEGYSPPEYVMEVTDKTRADVKGGTLVCYENKVRLLEIAQVPNGHVDEFTSVRRFRIFNTNNLWVNLRSLIHCVRERKLHMEVIVNPKTLDNGMNVLQFEEAAGSAIKNFRGALGINVPRSRFLPVKTTSDLLLIMSNLYVLEHGTLSMSPLRSFPTVPLIKLGDHFKKVKDFLNRFQSIPDLLELDHLTIAGDVRIGKEVSLKGTVIIIANHGDLICIPARSMLDNKIVSGNLHIMDH